jgi:hypothetical protein
MPVRKRNAGSDNSQKGAKNKNRHGSNKKRQLGNTRRISRGCRYCPNPMGMKLPTLVNLELDFKEQISEYNSSQYYADHIRSDDYTEEELRQYHLGEESVDDYVIVL